jgi:hypothetical protein
MKTRGRDSAAALAIVTPGSEVSFITRPEPPSELSDEQAMEWREVVNRLPAEWFTRETWALLVQYCRHVVAARRIAQLIADFESKDGDLDVAEYDRLLKMQEREGRAISSLATRMRLSQHSSYDKKKKKPIEAISKPWQE